MADTAPPSFQPTCPGKASCSEVRQDQSSTLQLPHPKEHVSLLPRVGQGTASELRSTRYMSEGSGCPGTWETLQMP